MKQRTLFIVAAGLIVTGVIGVAVAFVLQIAAVPTVPSGRGDGRAGPSDAMFIEQMVPHHQDAIDMSTLALTRAEHPEIRELAERIKESQSAENEQMREWYREWFGTQVPEVGDRGGMGRMMTDPERLRDAEDFDKEFIEQMVPHHRMAIMMARMAGRSTNRPEMRRLTDSIVETQSREIQDMQRWYQEWYGD